MPSTRSLYASIAVCAIGATALIIPTATATPATAAPLPELRINEVVSSGGTPDDWIEFVNTGAETFDLSGYRVQDDSDKNPYTFPAGTTVAPGEYLVIDAVKAGVGDFDFGLGGEDQVRLFDPSGDVFDSVGWETHGAPSWGRQDDGTLATTSAVTKGAANTFPSEGPGEPGPNEPDPAAGVVVNEIVYDKASGFEPDQVELYNNGTSPVDLTGWQVADDKRELETLPAGLVIEPGGYLVLLNGTHFSFGLGKGDAFYLHDASGTEIDGYAYANTAPLMTWARCPDGTGDWAPATVVTPGAQNICSAPETPGSVVLNEIDSQPADWVELYNPGTTPVGLGGFELRDNSDDHRWRFPSSASIAGGEYLVVEQHTVGLAYDDATDSWAEGAFGEPIGIGSADKIRLYDAGGELIDDSGSWTAHAAIDGDFAAATLARCPDGQGDFVLAHATPGATNNCVLPSIVINEIESNGDATDWVEVINTGTAAVDISGWIVLDDDPVGHAADTTPVAAGTVLQPGELYVFDQPSHFTFGLGAADTVTLRNAAGLVVAEHGWSAHASGALGRCPDGAGPFADLELSTKGLRNACGNPVRINELASNPVDWVELVNPTAAALDVSGIVIKDDDDSHAYTIPAGTSIAAGGYLVVEDLGFGLGKADSVRLFEDDALIDSTTWGPEHPMPSWGRCPDTKGPFAVTAEASKGAPNVCEGEIAATPWPGAAETQVLDPSPAFLSDSSGLDSQLTDEGAFLWAVDNGTGRFWKLAIAADGTTSFADGWESGKRARFQKDASNPGAAGPDAEGITVDGAGWIYLASERDNSAKGVNLNTVLKIDPNATGPDVVASQEWDLTALLPQVSANLGMEAIEWVSDADLAGRLWDRNTNAPYDPADYAGHGDGLFFVAVEDQGQVFAVALLGDGEARIVSELKPGLAGVMALDYDTVLDVLWAVCDDGCSGTAAKVSLNGTSTPEVAHVARPGGLPDINNEGFATAPAVLAVDGKRPVWWFADGFDSSALRLGWLEYTAPVDPVDPVDPTDPVDPVDPVDPTDPVDPVDPVDPTDPLPEEELTEANRGSISAPAVATLGSTIPVKVGASYDGSEVTIWLYSTPRLLGADTVANGSVQARIPADVQTGAHRIAAYDASGRLIGWTEITIEAQGSDGQSGQGGNAPDRLEATGAAGAPQAVLLAGALLLAGLAGIALSRARRREQAPQR